VVVNPTDDTIDFYTDVVSVKTRQIRVWDGLIEPDVDDDIDLGSVTKEFKDLYLDGIAYIDTLNVHVASDFIGTATFNDSVVIGFDATDTATFNADIASHLIPSTDDTYDLGAVGSEWRNAYVDGTAFIDTLEVHVGSTFTGTATFNDNVSLGQSSVDNITINGRVNSHIDADADNLYDLGSTTREFRNLYIDGIGYIDDIQGDTGTWSSTVSFNGTANFNGNINLGSDATDNITFNGDTVGNITPNVTNTDDIGATSFRYANLYVENLDASGNVTLGSAAADNITFNGDTVGNITPNVTNTDDIGAATFQYKDIYIDGVGYIDDIQGDTATFSSTVTFNGSVALGSDGADTITFNGDTAGHITPNVDNTDDIGSASFQYKDLYINGKGYIDTLDAFILDGTISGSDNTVDRINLKDYGTVTNNIGSVGGGTQDIDLTLGNSIAATVDTSTTTFTFSNPTASDELCGFTLKLTNGGSQTVNWPASVDWGEGTAPTLTASGVDVITFLTWDGGGIWYGVVQGLNYS
jgi:hypothetical protein